MNWIFLFLVILRSSLDIFTKNHVLLPFLNVPSTIGLLIILLAPAVFLRDTGGKRMTIHPIAIAWAGWLAYLLISVALGFEYMGGAGMGGAREWIRLFTIGIVFALSYSAFRDGIQGRKALNWLFLALPVPLVTALYQWIFHKGRILEQRHRVFGTMAHPNSLGLFLVLFIGLTFWKYRLTKKRPWLILLFIELFVLAKTLNIGGYFMLMVLLVWLFVRETKRGKIIIAVVGLSFLAMVLSGGEARSKLRSIRSMSPSAVAESLKEPDPKKIFSPAPQKGLKKESKRYKSSGEDSFRWRLGQWSELTGLWKQEPILGHGLHAILVINPKRALGWSGYFAHNDYLRYLVETGAVGLLIYLAFLTACGISIHRAYGSAEEPDIKGLLQVLFGVFLAWIVGSAADNLITMTSSQFCFWAALGIALRLNGERRNASTAARRHREITIVYPLDAGGEKYGGIETFIREMLVSFPESGGIRVVGISTEHSELRRGVWQEMKLGGKSVPFFPVLHVKDPNKRRRIPLFFRFTLALIRWRRKLDLEGGILNFHRLEPVWAFAGIKAERLLVVHGDMRTFSSPYCESRWRKIRRLYHILERVSIRSMRTVFVVSRGFCDYYRKRYPKMRERFHFIPVTFNADVFFKNEDLDKTGLMKRLSIPEGSPIVLFVGRLESAKDPFLLLDSFARLLKKIPAAVLFVVGGGGLEANLKKAAQGIIPPDHIFWQGPKNPREVAELMNLADVLILTSAFEGMPTVVLEALACGLPVVTTDVGDAGLVVKDGVNGRLVPSRDPEAIAQAMSDILADPPHFDPSRPPVSEYTQSKVLLRIFEELKRIRQFPDSERVGRTS